MKGGKPVLVSATLALAAHAALLLGPPHAGRGGASQAPAVAVRYVAEPPETAVPEPGPQAIAAPADEAPHPQAATAPAAIRPEAFAPDAEPPSFDEAASPRIGFPDAPMPAEGVQLRAYIELDGDGSPRLISIASPPGQAAPSPGFQKLAEYGLRQTRFKPGLGPAYCLWIRFEPDAPAPRLAWLPGAARDVARCLTGAMPPPRELDNAAAP